MLSPVPSENCWESFLNRLLSRMSVNLLPTSSRSIRVVVWEAVAGSRDQPPYALRHVASSQQEFTTDGYTLSHTLQTSYAKFADAGYCPSSPTKP
jgi:hypothetical protein